MVRQSKHWHKYWKWKHVTNSNQIIHFERGTHWKEQVYRSANGKTKTRRESENNYGISTAKILKQEIFVFREYINMFSLLWTL